MGKKPLNPSDPRAFDEFFSPLPDPRSKRNQQYRLGDILYIALAGIICGLDTWIDISEFAKSKTAWFKDKLGLKNGTPSHDTFGRVFSMLNPKKFQECFVNWIKAVHMPEPGSVVAIDGKSSRCSHDKANDKGMLHMVSALCRDSGIVLGQTAVDDKTNEIKAIPELLDLIEVKGCIVTIDAMGCQRDIAKKIIEKNADYVLALKGNQTLLHEDVALFFRDAVQHNFKDSVFSSHKTLDKGHGRIEKREYWITNDIDWLADKEKWAGLQGIGMVRSTRTVGEATSVEDRYYITSMKPEAAIFGDAVRGHWSIENNLHWILDVVFRDDASRVRKDHGPANFAILRRFSLNLIKKARNPKQSVNFSRHRASWDHAFLESILDGV